MRQTSTDHLREHREKPITAGQQFALDAFYSVALSLSQASSIATSSRTSLLEPSTRSSIGTALLRSSARDCLSSLTVTLNSAVRGALINALLDAILKPATVQLSLLLVSLPTATLLKALLLATSTLTVLLNALLDSSLQRPPLPCLHLHHEHLRNSGTSQSSMPASLTPSINAAP